MMRHTVSMVIGKRKVTATYEGDNLEWARSHLIAEQDRYEKACAEASMDVYEVFEIIMTEHETAQEQKIGKCPKCGSKELKERRDRVIFYSRAMFGPYSEISPYSHCESCGNDVETPTARHMSSGEAMEIAKRRIEQAIKIKEQYE